MIETEISSISYEIYRKFTNRLQDAQLQSCRYIFVKSCNFIIAVSSQTTHTNFIIYSYRYNKRLTEISVSFLFSALNLSSNKNSHTSKNVTKNFAGRNYLYSLNNVFSLRKFQLHSNIGAVSAQMQQFLFNDVNFNEYDLSFMTESR